MKSANNLASEWATIYDGSAQPDVLEFKFQNDDLITAGQTYSFRAYSRNVKGLSDPSDSIDIMAATIPAQMAAPSRIEVAIDSATLQTTVTIGWVALSPQQSGGSPVTAYRIRRNNGYDTSILENTFIEVADPSQLTHTFEAELLIGVTYKVIIAAINDVYTLNAFTTDQSTELVYSG